MKRDILDNLLRRKLKGYEQTPPSNMWAKIETDLSRAASGAESLPDGGTRPANTTRTGIRPHRMIRYVAAAALLAAALVLGVYFGNKVDPIAVSDPAQIPAVSPTIADTADTAQSAGVPDTPEATMAATVATEAGKTKKTMAAGAGSATAKSPETAAFTDTAQVPQTAMATTDAASVRSATIGSAAAGSEAMSSVPETTVLRAEVSETAVPQTEISETAVAETGVPQTAVADPETGMGMLPEWVRTSRQNEPKAFYRKKGSGVSASLYAANLTSGSQHSTSPGRVYAQFRESPARENTIMQQSANLLTVAPAQEDIIWNHRTPVTFGATVGFRIAPRIALETGIHYTRLRSTAGIQTLSSYELEQRLEYLGVPVSATYAFLDHRYVSLYGRAGVTLEYCVSAGVTSRSGSGSATGYDSRETLDVNGLQSSFGTGLGAMLNLTPHVGLYVEPGISYFHDNGGQPSSYRTEHPFTFDLRAGIRLNFR